MEVCSNRLVKEIVVFMNEARHLLLLNKLLVTTRVFTEFKCKI